MSNEAFAGKTVTTFDEVDGLSLTFKKSVSFKVPVFAKLTVANTKANIIKIVNIFSNFFI